MWILSHFGLYINWYYEIMNYSIMHGKWITCKTAQPRLGPVVLNYEFLQSCYKNNSNNRANVQVF